LETRNKMLLKCTVNNT